MIRNAFIVFAGAAVIAGAVGCGPASAAPVAEQGCADLGGTVTPDRTCHVHSNTSEYTIDITYPLDYPDPKAVSDFVKQDRDAFVKWVDEIGQGMRNRPYTYTVDAKQYRSGPPTPATQSLVLSIDNDTGAAHEAHPATSYKSFNFNLAKQVPITFDTLFKPDAKPVEVLTPLVRKLYDAPMLELLASQCQNFAITDDAVIFFFGEGQLIPADNTGPRQISVPRSELAPLMA